MKRDRANYVEVCFGCCALLDRGRWNVAAVYWGDGDPGRDEVQQQWRQTHVRLCNRCRAQISLTGILQFQIGDLSVELLDDTVPDLPKVRADRVLPVRAIRRLVE